VEPIIWGQIPGSVLLLLLVHMVKRVNNIVVNTKVWNIWWCGISSSWSVWVVPFAVFLLGEGKTVVGLRDILVLTEVWHKVIPIGWWVLLIVSDLPLVIVLLLGGGDRLVDIDVILVGSEVWNWVSSVWLCRVILDSPFVTELPLGKFDTLLGIVHVVISSEVGNFVVHVEWGFWWGRRPREQWFSLQSNGTRS